MQRGPESLCANAEKYVHVSSSVSMVLLRYNISQFLISEHETTVTKNTLIAFQRPWNM